MTSIYLDYNASTPIDPRRADAMRPFLDGAFGNPSSGHWAGAPAKPRSSSARPGRRLLGCEPTRSCSPAAAARPTIWRSRASFFARRDSGDHIVTTPVEHPAVLEPCRFLERLGARVTCLPVDRHGRVDPDESARHPPGPSSISVMHANNEVGTIQPIAEIAPRSPARTACCSTPTRPSRSARSRPTVDALGVDLLTIAGHKLYAPKGVGALYVRRGVELEPLIHGAGHEGGRRAGTESALLAVGLGGPARSLATSRRWTRLGAARPLLAERCRQHFGDRVVLNGHPEAAAAEHAERRFRRARRRRDAGAVAGVAASTGSACHAGRVSCRRCFARWGCGRESAWAQSASASAVQRPADEIDAVVTDLSRILPKAA